MNIWVDIPDAGEGHLFLTDTGCGYSLYPIRFYSNTPKFARKKLEGIQLELLAGNATRVAVYGKTTITLLIEKKLYEHDFIIVEDTVIPILGRDFMRKFDLHHRISEGKIYIGDQEVPSYTNAGLRGSGESNLYHFHVVQPNTEAVLSAKVSGQDPEGTVGVFTPAKTLFDKTGALGCHIAVTKREGEIPVRVLNPSPIPHLLRKGTFVGKFEAIEEARTWETSHDTEETCTSTCTCSETAEKQQLNTFSLQTDSIRKTQSDGEIVDCCHKLAVITPSEVFAAINRDDVTSPQGSDVTKLLEEIPEHLKPLFKDSISRLETPKLKRRLANVFKEYAHCFAKDSDDIGKTTLIKHDIDTGDEPPVRQRGRRFAKCHIDIIKKEVAKLANSGLIKPSESEWASNCLIVKKKDGTWRLCIDYRALNAKTKNPDTYTLPRIDDTIDALSNAKYLCTLDIIQGYHQVELTERSKPKTAFYAPQCNPSQWEYIYMPFGLVRAPRTFQRLMDKVIRGLEHRIALAYLDDIIVYGATQDECITNLLIVFERLAAAHLKLKPKKCMLFATEVNYLGHVITSHGVKTDPIKVEAVKNWHAPRTVKQVRSFLGMVTYYSKFVKNFADLCRPLNHLTKKNVTFEWTDECQQAFEEIKKQMSESPVLAYPKSEGMFILDTDASKYAYAGVLSQMQLNPKTGVEEERVIAYASRNFNDAERRCCTRKREMTAIIRMVKHFDVYVRGQTFLIRTDHASLQYIKTMKDMPDQYSRWIMTLEEYSYKIEIRKGTLHSNADAMSRGCHGPKCICEDVAR